MIFDDELGLGLVVFLGVAGFWLWVWRWLLASGFANCRGVWFIDMDGWDSLLAFLSMVLLPLLLILLCIYS